MLEGSRDSRTGGTNRKVKTVAQGHIIGKMKRKNVNLVVRLRNPCSDFVNSFLVPRVAILLKAARYLSPTPRALAVCVGP